MRGSERKITLTKFLFMWFGLLFALFLASSIFAVDYICRYASEENISTNMKKEIRKSSRMLLDDESSDAEADRIIEMEECCVVLLDDKGDYVRGIYPEEWHEAVDAKVRESRVTRRVKTSDDEYYVIDRIVGRDLRSINAPDFNGYCIRAIADADETETVYHAMRNRYYLMVAAMSLMLFVIAAIVYRKVSKPVQDMVDKAESISRSGTFSERINNDSQIYETEILINAYNRILDNAEDLLRQQEKFNSDISHELRTPIAIIRSECELIRELQERGITEEIEESLDVIKQQIDRMNDMITALLYLSRLDQMETLQDIERIDILDILESVSEDTQYILQGSRTIEEDFHSAPADVDLTLIMIAIRNLIDNAVKYSAEGSVIKLSNTADDKWIYFSVEDEGIGIAEEDRQKIFDLYYQVSKARNSGGFGLGLTLAQRIAHKHGGYITVSSEVNKGSTFTLVIPVAKEEK